MSWAKHQAETFEKESTDSIMKPGKERSRVDFILKNVGTGKEVMEIGANHGHVAEEIRKLGNRVTAIDFPEVVKIGKKKYPQLHWYGLDVNENFAYDLFDPDYDVIVASEIIEHLLDADHFLKECISLLKPGGKILLTTPNVARPANVVQMLVGNHVRGFFHDEEKPMHIRFYTAWTLKALLARHGFYDLVMAPASSGSDGFDHKGFSDEENKFLEKMLHKRKYPEIEFASIICVSATRPK